MKIFVFDKDGWILEEEEKAFRRIEEDRYGLDGLVFAYMCLLQHLEGIRRKGPLLRWFHKRIALSIKVLALRFAAEDKFHQLHRLCERVRRGETRAAGRRQDVSTINVRVSAPRMAVEPRGWVVYDKEGRQYILRRTTATQILDSGEVLEVVVSSGFCQFKGNPVQVVDFPEKEPTPDQAGKSQAIVVLARRKT